MPKEGFHLYLADRYLRRCGNNLPEMVRQESRAFLLGSLSPDIFFYDLPSFSQTSVGNALHDLMEREGVTPIRDWVTESNFASPDSHRARKLAWAIGFVSHFLADAIWHPIINELCSSLDFCGKEGLTWGFNEEDCHHLLECELEAFWLEPEGVSGHYVDFLHDFRKDRFRLLQIASFYRQFLEYAGLRPAPREKRILKCYRDQNFLLRLFALPILGKLRDRMTAFHPTRYFGALVVPALPALPEVFIRGEFPEERNPFTRSCVDRWFASLTALLSEWRLT